MQLEKLRIHNFRSIVDGEFYFGDYSLLIGANNAGKSNVIDALRVLYEKGLKYEQKRDFTLCNTEDEECWIEAGYIFTESEKMSLKESYRQPNNRLRIRKYLKSGNNRSSGIYAYEGDQLSNDSFYGARGVQQGKLGELIYIPAVSRLEDQTKLTGPSPLRELLSGIVTDLVQESPVFDQLMDNFHAFAQEFKVEKTNDERSLQGLEAEINQELTRWGLGFELGINSIADSAIVKSLLEYKIMDNDLEVLVDASQQGHGFQRHLIFTLIQMAAKHQSGDKSSAKRKEFSPDLRLILFEEPEAFLHPEQQDSLSRNLKSIASETGHQVIVTSHSPHFVSQNSDDIPSIVRLCREDGETRVGQVHHSKLQELLTDNQQINSILSSAGKKYQPETDDCRQDMEVIKYFMWLNPERCGMFFAEQVLLVEGPTERVLINYLFDTGMLEMPPGGAFVLDCMGKFNLHRFMNLLGEMRTYHSVLFDGDMQRGPHPEIKKLIHCMRNSYTHEIKEFPNEIEDFLGIDKAGKPHRKPQHVMLCLKDGKIGSQKINDLVSFVQGLIR